MKLFFVGIFEASNYIELTTCCQNMWLYKPILTIHPRIYTVEDVGPKLVLEVFLKDEDIEQKIAIIAIATTRRHHEKN